MKNAIRVIITLFVAAVALDDLLLHPDAALEPGQRGLGVALGLVAAVGAAVVYYVGGVLAVEGAILITVNEKTRLIEDPLISLKTEQESQQIDFKGQDFGSVQLDWVKLYEGLGSKK